MGGHHSPSGDTRRITTYGLQIVSVTKHAVELCRLDRPPFRHTTPQLDAGIHSVFRFRFPRFGTHYSQIPASPHATTQHLRTTPQCKTGGHTLRQNTHISNNGFVTRPVADCRSPVGCTSPSRPKQMRACYFRITHTTAAHTSAALQHLTHIYCSPCDPRTIPQK